MFFAHAEEVLGTSVTRHDMDWGSPLGVTIFLVGATLAFFLFSLAVKNFTELDERTKKKK